MITFTRLKTSFAFIVVIGLTGSCTKKTADPSAIAVGNKDVTAANSGINTIGGATGSTGSAGSSGGTTGQGSGSTGSTGTGGSGSAGTNNGSSGGNGSTGNGSTGITGGSTNTGAAAGTVNINGDNGIAIGAVNTLVIKAGNDTYKLTTPGSDLLMCSVVPAIPPSTTEPVTSIGGIDLNQDVSLTIQLEQQKTGVFDIKVMSLDYKGGQYNTMFTSGGRINIQTFTLRNYIATTKGTFDAILGKATTAPGPDQIRVSGSFNLQ